MKHFKTILAVLCAAFACPFVACTSCNNNENDMSETVNQNPVVVMETSMGTMKIELYNATPQHRDNFLKLARAGFYDGLRFHRVIPGFMIQGGDPLSKEDSLMMRWGTGGPGYTIPAEISGEFHHKKGALAAARMGDMANPRRASSGSQFYIVQSEEGCMHLDGQYTVYGEVIEGLEVIDAIADVPTDAYDRPMDPVTILKVYPFVAAAAADSTSINAAAASASTSVTDSTAAE